jgi:catechol 2,3-dioxygenase-like lactoylglutathione lyase family enzyme
LGVVVTAYNLSHVAFLVQDLDAAMEKVGDTLGIRFLPPILAEVPILEQGSSSTTTRLRLSWSREGPPHVELIEAQGDGLYSAGRGEGFHHLGTWQEDFNALFARLDERGIPTEALQRERDRSVIASYTLPSSLYGMRLEFVSEMRKTDIQLWLQGGEWGE